MMSIHSIPGTAIQRMSFLLYFLTEGIMLARNILNHGFMVEKIVIISDVFYRHNNLIDRYKISLNK